MLTGKRILLIISGGIAAYKGLELIRRLGEAGAAVRCILTKGGADFITPLSVSSLSGDKTYMELFSLTDEAEMGHIRLSREADLVVVAPATAHIMARMAAGLADDLATTTLLATDKPVLIAPAMNVEMWRKPATQRNLQTLIADGVAQVGPESGDLACGEEGMGRMAEVEAIVRKISGLLTDASAPNRPATGQDNLLLAGRRALVTSGPTHEPIDPVRYIANRSSGRQGHAIAAALARLGAATTLVTGPTPQPDPWGVTVIRVETALEMRSACDSALPADVAVCAAAVADWRVSSFSDQKLKKGPAAVVLPLVENPDILHGLATRTDNRPALVIGFAAETENVIENARAKLGRKGCDWILANDVSPQTGILGGDTNTVCVIDATHQESWPTMDKETVAERLAQRIAEHLNRDLDQAASS